MAHVKSILFFEAGKHGWSETYYRDEDDLTLALTKLKALASTRALMLGTGATITYARVSKEGIFRDSRVESFVGQGMKSEVEGASEVAYSVWLARLQANDTMKRQLYLSGMPDVDVSVPEDKAAHGALLKAFDKFVKKLKDDQWAIRGNDKTALNPEKAVTDIALDGGLVKVTIPNHGWQTNDIVVIRNARGVGKMNGKFEVLKVDDDNIKLRGNTANVIYTGGAKARKQSIILAPIVEGVLLRQTHRDRGSPFDRPRCARRKKKTV